MIPRSAAILATVADPVLRYSSTASRRNPAEYVFLAMSRSSRFLQAKPGFSVSTPGGKPLFLYMLLLLLFVAAAVATGPSLSHLSASSRSP
jgi:hypothetical protein